MAQNRRNPLLPWWIGLVIIAGSVGYVAYQFSCTDCGLHPGLLGFLVLGVIPVVYLVLMYLTFTSQARDELRNPNQYDPR